MKEELYDDPFYNDEFNNEWYPEDGEGEELTYDQEGLEQENFGDLPDWLEDIEDPDTIEEFNFDNDIDDDFR